VEHTGDVPEHLHATEVTEVLEVEVALVIQKEMGQQIRELTAGQVAAAVQTILQHFALEVVVGLVKLAIQIHSVMEAMVYLLLSLAHP